MNINTLAPNVGFGTSGIRALVSDLTSKVVAAYIRAFIQHLRDSQQIQSNRCVLGWDLRPSSPQIAGWVAAVLVQEGLEIDWAGYVPTPALALRALVIKAPGIMISGSHIPFDRNGIKFYTEKGEILKSDEAGIAQIDLNPWQSNAEHVQRDFDSLMPQMIDKVAQASQSNSSAYNDYVDRYLMLLPENTLNGLKIGVYQHSAVGRDLLVNLLRRLGAEVVVLGRSDTFVPIDTEAVSKQDEAQACSWCREHQLDAVVSTDGDGDRPWICDETGRFLRGDLVGILTAQWLGANAVVTPVSSNTALEKSKLFDSILRTRIGSPFVIEGMQLLATQGLSGIVGFEANGGVLVQDTLRGLHALPTRDSVLPILAILTKVKETGIPLSHLSQTLPQRCTQADRIQDFPNECSRSLITSLIDDRVKLEKFLSFAGSNVSAVNTIDGLRTEFESGDVVHLRPSGNAPELRCYTESASNERASLLLTETLKAIGLSVNFSDRTVSL